MRKRSFCSPIINSSGVELIVSPSYDQLPDKVRDEIPEEKLIKIPSVVNYTSLSGMGEMYIVFITGEDHYDEVVSKLRT